MAVKGTALQLAVNCSGRVLNQVHAAFKMTTEGGDYDGFAAYCKMFWSKYYESSASFDTLKTQVHWDTAALFILKKYEEQEGTMFNYFISFCVNCNVLVCCFIVEVYIVLAGQVFLELVKQQVQIFFFASEAALQTVLH